MISREWKKRTRKKSEKGLKNLFFPMQKLWLRGFD
jgi:hypothetical protein